MTSYDILYTYVYIYIYIHIYRALTMIAFTMKALAMVAPSSPHIHTQKCEQWHCHRERSVDFFEDNIVRKPLSSNLRPPRWNNNIFEMRSQRNNNPCCNVRFLQDDADPRLQPGPARARAACRVQPSRVLGMYLMV